LELGNTLGTKPTKYQLKDLPMAGHLTPPARLVMRITVVIKMGKRYLKGI
jgi:hypothetical protein